MLCSNRFLSESFFRLHIMNRIKAAGYAFLQKYFRSIRSVSYTHLDVYKRQPRTQENKLDIALTLFEALRPAEDVYKRQGPTSADCPAAPWE